MNRRALRGAAPLLVASIVAAATLIAGTPLTVHVRETRLREDAKFWAPSIAPLTAGTTVDEIEKRGDWIRVRAGGTEGWLHASAVTETRLTLTGGGEDVDATATADEVSLAGKGFDEEIEKAYRARHAELDFAAVDRIGDFDVSETEIQAFLEAGGLADWGTP